LVTKKAPKQPKEVTLKFTVAELSKLQKKLVQANDSVDSVELIHVLPYLTPVERINLMNELQRVLKKGAKCQLVMPHWASNRAYADLRFQYPPVAESWFFSLNEDYRKQDPNFDKRYKCNFDFTCGYSLHPHLISRNQEYQQHAITFWKEAAQDMIATVTKR
jgi:hypothetical protein